MQKTMTRLEANSLLLSILSQYINTYPDQRFGQALFNLGFVQRIPNSLSIQDPFYEESTATLNRIAKLVPTKPSPLTKLMDDFPLIFTKSDYSLPDAWEPIVRELCEELTELSSLYSNVNPQHFECVQMKEKFGELRFYTHSTLPIANSLINLATLKTRNICQYCKSNFNVSLHSPKGWLTYLCDDCAKPILDTPTTSSPTDSHNTSLQKG